MIATVEKITKALQTLHEWSGHEEGLMLLNDLSYMPDKSKDYRIGRASGIRSTIAKLGLLMLEKGIDIRKQNDKSS